VAEPIRVTGLFSAFDTESVISQLRAAKQSAVTRLDIQASTATAKRSTLANIQSKFLALLTRSSSLMTSTSVSGKTAAVSGTGLTASASPTSATGTFKVDVLKLATKTATAGNAISAAVDATSPLSASNFGIAPTNGKFTIKTASGGTEVFSIGASAANSAATIENANFATAITAGTFTIETATGGAHTFSIDPTTQSLDDILGEINGAGIGVTATITNDANGRANRLTLTSAEGDITLGASGDTSNFLAATNLNSGSASDTKTSALAFTKQMSLNDVIADINGSGIGVTATIENDANGRANLLTFNSSQGDITLGSAGDTSNFLTATNVLASPGTTTRQATIGMARLSTSAKMESASWHGGPPASGDQSFTINGATISYNTASDSLSDVITRINASTANVTARYDAISDTVRLESTKPGSLGITIQDDAGGNLLAKLGLTTATQELGANAEYKIDGGPIQYASSNAVTLASGVSLALTAVTEVDKPATVTVNQDTTAALNTVRSFVTAVNDIFTAIDAATKADPKNPGIMSGDSSLRQLRSTLRSTLSTTGVNINGNFTRLDEIGIGFGAPGAAIGTTNTLTLDENKFRAVLASDPSSVQAVLSSFTLSAGLEPGGTSSITGISGTFTGQVAGTYRITDNGAGLLTSVFTPKNGGPQLSTTSPITAGGTNSTLIPGITLQIASLFQEGSQLITVGASSKSPIQAIRELAENQAGAGNVIQKRQDTYTKVTDQISIRRERMLDRIDKEMEVLRKKFAAMEQAQAKYQGIASSLAGMISQLQASNNQ